MWWSFLNRMIYLDMLVVLIESSELRQNCINDNWKAVAAMVLMLGIDAMREALVSLK
jgi:hypothetical protein